MWVANGEDSKIMYFDPGNIDEIPILITNENYFKNTRSITFGGGIMWITSFDSNFISGLNVSKWKYSEILIGEYLLKLDASQYNFSKPRNMVFDGINIWVTNYGNDSVTAFKAEDGSFVTNLTNSVYNFKYPSGITFDGENICVTNLGSNMLTFFNAKTYKFVSNLKITNDQEQTLDEIIFVDNTIWTTTTSKSLIGINTK